MRRKLSGHDLHGDDGTWSSGDDASRPQTQPVPSSRTDGFLVESQGRQSPFAGAPLFCQESVWGC